MSDVDRIPNSTRQEEPRTAEELLPLVYDELRRFAARKLTGEHNEHTLQPTALVHEAWLKIASRQEHTWQGRQHFVAVAAEAMRRILVDRARRRQAVKRGAGAPLLPLDHLEIAHPAPDDQLLAINEALATFARIDSRKAQLVNLRYFMGMTFEEAAEVLGIAVPTAKQWWAYARCWLQVEMVQAPSGDGTA
jgi:RNA polymerase sigma factor (TIGR02999 family)